MKPIDPEAAYANDERWLGAVLVVVIALAVGAWLALETAWKWAKKMVQSIRPPSQDRS